MIPARPFQMTYVAKYFWRTFNTEGWHTFDLIIEVKDDPEHGPNHLSFTTVEVLGESGAPPVESGFGSAAPHEGGMTVDACERLLMEGARVVQS